MVGMGVVEVEKMELVLGVTDGGNGGDGGDGGVAGGGW